MSKISVVIRRNGASENGMYGLSIHDEPGGSATIKPIESEDDLRKHLRDFGLTKTHAEDVIKRLAEKHESVTLSIAGEQA